MSDPDSLFYGPDGRPFQSLPDFMGPDLSALSIGLNPGFRSIQAGFYFANPRNRFWQALNESGLSQKRYQPSLESNRLLLEHEKIGFTDVVKRPTSGASDLRAADFNFWAPQLKKHLSDYQPKIAWFHGKIAYSNYLRGTGEGRQTPVWGLQPETLGATCFFISPNPSPANAAFSLEVITYSYTQLVALMKSD
jgi:TDG/mug DNA glycosylase family protein